MTVLTGVTSGILSDVLSNTVFSTGANIHIMVVGDSLGAGISTGTAKDDFIEALAGFNITAEIEDASQGSKKLIGDFVNTTFDGVGAEYADEITSNANKGKVTDIIISLGTNDIGEVAAGTYTKANFNTSLTFLINYMFADTDLSSLKRVHVVPLGRHTVTSSLGFQTTMNGIRQAQVEVCNALSNVFLTSPNYHLDYADSVHPTTGSYTTWVQALSADIAFRVGQSSKANAGMIVTGASVSELGIDLTIQHGLGTDFTVPSTAGDGIEATRIFSGSTELSYTKYERVNANTLRLHAGAPFTGTPDITTIYGSLYDLGVTSVPMVKDNSDYTMPLKALTPVTATASSDPIVQLTGLKVYMNPAFDKTFTTGTNFDEIKGVDGTTWTAINSDFDYDGTAFSGSGGVKVTNINGALRADGDLLSMGASDTWMYGGIMDVQANGDFLSLGSTSFGAYASANFYIEGGALKVFRLDGSPNIVTIATGLSGTKISVIINVRSQTECDVYVNDVSSPTATVDLGNSYFFGWETIFISAARSYQSTSNLFGLTFGKDGAHNASNDPSLSTLMTFMNNWKDGN